MSRYGLQRIEMLRSRHRRAAPFLLPKPRMTARSCEGNGMMTDDDPNAQANPGTPMSSPALMRLAAFVGEWAWEAAVGDQAIGNGRTLFDWLEDGRFLVEHADTDQAEFPSATAIIGGDDATATYSMLQVDSRVVCRVYQMSLSDGVWRLWRDAPGFWQRFTGTFSGDSNTISGRWEKSADGVLWEYDFDLTYTRRT